MAKAKTHQATKKRIKITKGGKMLKKHANTGHLKVKQSAKTIRRKGGEEEVSHSMTEKVRRLLPYGGK